MKNFGFGCMRLPMTEQNEVDYTEFSKMIDVFLEAGFTYFDTAHPYLEEKSEIAIRECLVKRYPRDRYILTNKLTSPYFETEAEIEPLFEQQLAACGVEYFDYYLMHAQNKRQNEKYTQCHAYEVAGRLKAQGKIRHIGISFHDRANVLDDILNQHSEIEVVQIQFNYTDYEDLIVQSRLCYEVCRKHDKPVIVMEPVKGGTLLRLPERAKAVFDRLGGGSYASYAIRFAASFEGVFMVLSGMSSLEQMLDNISYMKEFQPLSKEEFAAIDEVREIFRSQGLIPCTACRYCVDGCPKKIDIPALFSCMNAWKVYSAPNSPRRYLRITEGKGKASDCVKCGRCEQICPQTLQIRSLLEKVADEFESNA